MHENVYRFANMFGIISFLTCLIVFSVTFRTPDTHKVLLYFIPDMILLGGNMIMTFVLYYKEPILKVFLNNIIVKISIILGYWINIASAIFYLLMLIDNTLIDTGLFDNDLFSNLWH